CSASRRSALKSRKAKGKRQKAKIKSEDSGPRGPSSSTFALCLLPSRRAVLTPFSRGSYTSRRRATPAAGLNANTESRGGRAESSERTDAVAHLRRAPARRRAAHAVLRELVRRTAAHTRRCTLPRRGLHGLL